MRPTISRPSKRYYRRFGEKIVTVIGLLSLVVIAIAALVLYKTILP